MNNCYKIEFSKNAQNDLKDIIHYIKYKLQEPNIAKKISLKIKEKIMTLSHSPYLYAIVHDNHLEKLELRKLIVDNYIIFYRIKENDNLVQIVRIMYGRRNWIELL